MILLNNTIILLSAVIFLIIILLLVVILLYAKSKLIPSGNAKININDEKEFEVSLGNNLLNTLAEKK